MVWQVFGVIGLLCITAGVLLRRRQLQDEFYVAGGIGLLIYSISIQDWIFIVLQVIFILVAVYDLITGRNK